MSDASDAANWERIDLDASKVFTPTSPIDERSLFAGREDQIRLVIDAVNQKGQHAILYGERGVGKTSLANVLSSFLSGGNVLSPRVNCDVGDTFDSVWRKVFDEIHLVRRKQRIGIGAKAESENYPSSELIAGAITPDVVRRQLSLLSAIALPILIIDEFDRLNQEPRQAFADTIKALSDHAVGATVLLVGVADSVEQLILEHASVERALVQIRMPRMSREEINKIVETGVGRLTLEIERRAMERISRISQGLPHYAHLLGLYATRAAVRQYKRKIDPECVVEAIDRAVDATQQSIRSGYEIAVRSSRKDSLFADVLLSSALADTNELGYFAAQDVRAPLRKVTGKKYEIPSFAQHLNEFCEEKRGPILKKTGTKRLFRYRFLNPLMQPFILMQGMRSGRITSENLD